MSSSSLSNIGSYPLILKAFFSSSTSYSVYRAFTLKVVSSCSLNVITAPILGEYQYSIGDPVLIITISEWTMTMPSCGPLTYIAQLVDSTPLPNLMKFKTSSLTLSVDSPIGSDEKAYLIKIIASSSTFDPSSTLMTTFEINVVCKPNKLSAKIKEIQYSFSLGSFQPLII